MSVYLLTLRDRTAAWFVARAHGAYATFWLAALAFTESSFFIIPADILLVAILLVGSQRWVYYASVTTLASVAGAVAGYLIGLAFYDTLGERIIDIYGLQEQMGEIGRLFSDTAFWSILFAAFTPIPYKVFVLAAGFFHVDFLVFILASFIGRGARFFAVAYLIRLYGPLITAIVFRYFTIITYTLVAFGVIYALIRFL